MSLDKSLHNAVVHSQIASQYADQYFSDTTDYPFFEQFVALIKPGGRLLDVACGPGMFTKYFLEKGFQAEGIDLSSEMVSIAKKNVPKADFQEMDMRQLDYPDQTFDALLVAYALIFIPSQETAHVLAEFKRVLKPGGKLLIICQEGEGDHEEKEPMKPEATLYVNFFSINILKELLESTGLKVIKQVVTRSRDPFGMSTGLIYSFAEKANA
jgi:ubiquinone/menaquinone biosynthesis C-methylase UbiE